MLKVRVSPKYIIISLKSLQKKIVKNWLKEPRSISESLQATQSGNLLLSLLFNFFEKFSKSQSLTTENNSVFSIKIYKKH